MVGYIYLIIDLTNWKKYVGQHHYHIENLDPNYHGSGHIIKMIYKKRPETLKEVYLKTCYTQEELDEWEKYFIFLYDTLWPNGYNLTEGGGGGVPCEETRRKMSNSQKGKPSTFKGKHHSEESRRKLSEAQKKYVGEKHPMFGKHHSEETKKKLSDSHKGKQIGEDNPFFGKHHKEETLKKLSKVILQFTRDGELIREWPSLSECTRNGFFQSSVCRCCQGKSTQYKGFVWKYKD